MTHWIAMLWMGGCSHPSSVQSNLTWSPASSTVSPPPIIEDVPGHPDHWYNQILWDDAEIPQFDVYIDDLAFASLLASPSTWVEGQFSYKGVTYAPIGVRCKGENSFLPIDQKCSLKIDFNRYADMEFMGLDGLTLNNMSNDTTMMHERVAYRMYRDAGIPAVRASHARVRLNGGPEALYALLEDVDSDMIRQWRDPDGSMFEIWDVDFTPFYVLDDNPDDGDFQFEFGDPSDRDQILDLAYALESPAALGIDRASAFIDYDQFVLYWAVSSVVGQFDSYPYSSPGDDAHIYLDPETGLFQFVPHGADETFYDPWRDIDGVNGLLGVRCNESVACTDSYRTMTWEMSDLAIATNLLGHAEFVRDQIAVFVAADEAKSVVYDTETVYASQAEMLNFIRHRETDLTREIGPHP